MEEMQKQQKFNLVMLGNHGSWQFSKPAFSIIAAGNKAIFFKLNSL